MPTGELFIDLEAVAANWRALDTMSAETVETAAVVKADGYGLGAVPVAQRLAQEGVRAFFVATAAEGVELRRALGPEPRIYVFYGHMPGEADTLKRADLVPLICSILQLTAHLETLPRHPFGLQLDTGMNRLGLKPAEWDAVREIVLAAEPVLITSHLASADTPEDPQSADQLARFREMTEGVEVPLSLAATGGTLLGNEYHFDMVRPGIGLYGGLPFAAAEPVVALDLPVISCFDVAAGETVGYNATWRAGADTRIATIAGGYADGLHRALQPAMEVMAGPVPCPVVGRVSMDLLTVDIGHLDGDPSTLSVLGPHHGIDALARTGGTIGYEILTSLGRRYRRNYRGMVAG
ncbi:alanine racemase [Jannaschia aquimarina]|uniref:Alanine racemase n=1 Tax=Jannaschia aquimarina TaxID=935700 RepID=A0A0D1EGW5_9RHOB|nr:alanine racemase [Jannaschia aquimarina]KIT16146.1 Alanine racemase, catabolic [Jannaschia aquimarina]SNT37168.1 alanine racemase [Jannaschia aquimarina]